MIKNRPCKVGLKVAKSKDECGGEMKVVKNVVMKVVMKVLNITVRT